MNDGPKTQGLNDIQLGNRPLIICDIDEVVLEFVTPFDAFLKSQGHELLARSFRLTGNVVTRDGGAEASAEQVSTFLDLFFGSQQAWQTPAKQAGPALGRLSKIADVLFMTAMPVRHYDTRRALLDKHGFPYPMIATEGPKGPLIKNLHDARPLPLFFVDDLPHNLHSVKEHTPSAHLLHYMANDTFREMAPHPGEDVSSAASWPEVESVITESIVAHQTRRVIG